MVEQASPARGGRRRPASAVLAAAAAAAAGLGVLSGCVVQDPYMYSMSPNPYPMQPVLYAAPPPVPGGTDLISPHLAMARVPPGHVGETVVVRREVGPTMLRDDVMLVNRTSLPRPNRLTVRTVRRGTGPFGGWAAPSVGRFTDEGVGSSVALEFPNAAGADRTREGRNAYGPYAYRTGRYPDGTTCVLAWQMVDAHNGWAEGIRTHAVEWRVCDPELGVEELLQPFDRLTIGG